MTDLVLAGNEWIQSFRSAGISNPWDAAQVARGLWQYNISTHLAISNTYQWSYTNPSGSGPVSHNAFANAGVRLNHPTFSSPVDHTRISPLNSLATFSADGIIPVSQFPTLKNGVINAVVISHLFSEFMITDHWQLPDGFSQPYTHAYVTAVMGTMFDMGATEGWRQDESLGVDFPSFGVELMRQTAEGTAIARLWAPDNLDWVAEVGDIPIGPASTLPQAGDNPSATAEATPGFEVTIRIDYSGRMDVMINGEWVMEHLQIPEATLTKLLKSDFNNTVCVGLADNLENVSPGPFSDYISVEISEGVYSGRKAPRGGVCLATGITQLTPDPDNPAAFPPPPDPPIPTPIPTPGTGVPGDQWTTDSFANLWTHDLGDSFK